MYGLILSFSLFHVSYQLDVCRSHELIQIWNEFCRNKVCTVCLVFGIFVCVYDIVIYFCVIAVIIGRIESHGYGW